MTMPDAWSVSTWGSRARTRCGCSTRRATRSRNARRGRPWRASPRSRPRRWPAHRRAPGWRWSIEPTGPAWLPIAVFFIGRGHVVHRVSSAKAADLRRFLSRHTKTNGIDADTLARLPLFDPAGLQPLELPGAERAALDRRVRATDRLTRAGAEHKTPDQGPGPPAAADDAR